jgi:hypothetical protein
MYFVALESACRSAVACTSDVAGHGFGGEAGRAAGSGSWLCLDGWGTWLARPCIAIPAARASQGRRLHLCPLHLERGFPHMPVLEKSATQKCGPPRRSATSVIVDNCLAHPWHGELVDELKRRPCKLACGDGVLGGSPVVITVMAMHLLSSRGRATARHAAACTRRRRRRALPRRVTVESAPTLTPSPPTHVRATFRRSSGILAKSRKIFGSFARGFGNSSAGRPRRTFSVFARRTALGFLPEGLGRVVVAVTASED